MYTYTLRFVKSSQKSGRTFVPTLLIDAVEKRLCFKIIVCHSGIRFLFFIEFLTQIFNNELK